MMDAVCKMTGEATTWPCSAPGCPLYGDCLSEYAGSTKPMTNADRIRAMSDEELAKFIATPCQCEVRPKRDGFRECGNDLCLQYLLKWLRQPAEEDT